MLQDLKVQLVEMARQVLQARKDLLEPQGKSLKLPPSQLISRPLSPLISRPLSPPIKRPFNLATADRR